MSRVIKWAWKLIAWVINSILSGAALLVLIDKGYPLERWLADWISKMSEAAIASEYITAARLILAGFSGLVITFFWYLFRVGERIKAIWYKDRVVVFDGEIEQIRKEVRTLTQIFTSTGLFKYRRRIANNALNAVSKSVHSIWNDAKLNQLKEEFLDLAFNIFDYEEEYPEVPLLEEDHSDLWGTKRELYSLAEKIDRRIIVVAQRLKRIA